MYVKWTEPLLIIALSIDTVTSPILDRVVALVNGKVVQVMLSAWTFLKRERITKLKQTYHTHVLFRSLSQISYSKMHLIPLTVVIRVSSIFPILRLDPHTVSLVPPAAGPRMGVTLYNPGVATWNNSCEVVKAPD